MLFKESIWIRDQLEILLGQNQIQKVVNLGSSSKNFSGNQQGYIFENIFAKLELVSQVINIDIRDELGVDLVLDFMQESSQVVIQELQADLTLVCNLLEHLESAELGIEALKGITKPGSLLILTGPRIFPFHPDPIDNRFRPTKRNLKRILGGSFKIIEIDLILGGSVLTCTSPRPAVAYKWYFSLFQMPMTLYQVRRILSATRNLVFPAIAFACLLEKLPSEEILLNTKHKKTKLTFFNKT
jgi:hypothetical protein